MKKRKIVKRKNVERALARGNPYKRHTVWLEATLTVRYATTYFAYDDDPSPQKQDFSGFLPQMPAAEPQPGAKVKLVKVIETEKVPY